MRIAMVSETFPPEINGVALTVAGLVDGLREAGHTVQVVRPRQLDTDDNAGHDQIEIWDNQRGRLAT